MCRIFRNPLIKKKAEALLQKARKEYTAKQQELEQATTLLKASNGVSMKEVQEWLGHSDYGTTANIYSHLEYSSKVSSAQKMNEVLAIK